MYNNIQEKNDLPPDTPEMMSVLIRSAPTLPGPPSRVQFPKRPEAAALPSRKSPPAAEGLDWNPKEIPKVPEYYPLSRSRVTVDCDVCEVTGRIGDCLKQHQLSVTFEENTALCVTPCHTHFTVTIFENDNHFIVEVQRRTGCSIKCQQFCRAILRAAKGIKSAPIKTPQFSIPSSIRKMHEQKEEEKAVDDDVNNALHLLDEDSCESQLLGMSALISITRERKVSIDESKLGFLKRFLSSRSPYSKKYDNESKLRLDALTVLANLLMHKSITCNYVIESELLQLLIVDLTHDDLNASYQAARSMTAICRCCPQFKSNIAGLGAATAAEQLEEMAEARHKPLKDEIRLLRVELED
eukprot:CAMPEP_0194215998 /NCGR_PEP_ID=MMETSP0156-20130528/18207_1 /TAXON_ID=33649 /ORGANISM="Thalassionema nitzschioides, Strain L26-B" /LENGTH=354 /DNA_ID=CAMNT_0038944663 /DNA_START=20 /DNA_END=1084 /DNA_ORIENTATION=-